MNRAALKAAYNSQRIREALKAALCLVSLKGQSVSHITNKKGRAFMTIRYNPKQGFTITLIGGKVFTLKQFLTMVK